MINKLGHWLLSHAYDRRSAEYEAAERYLSGHEKILDAGCGTGTFLLRDPEKRVGIDINPDNVAYCQEHGLNAEVGDALNIPYPDNSFDGVHCSHVMQVFQPDEAVQVIRELGRVTRPGGTLVITTLNRFSRFFRHPENARPYPPDAIERLFAARRGASSPMFPDMPDLERVGLWLRRTPLIEFYSSTRPSVNRLCLILNAVQYGLWIRRYWSYDAYVMAMKKTGP